MTQAEFAAALLDPAHPGPVGLRCWNGSDPAQRLAVHRNNVSVSLVDALADSFAVVQALVGETFFRAMALEYVRCQPPRSVVLARHGDGLPDFIAQFPPAAGLPYLADVARLEALRSQASQAADALPLRALDATVQAALQDAAQAAGLRLQLHPSAAVLDARHAAVSLWAAHQGLLPLEDVDPLQPEAALVVRPDMDVLVLRLPPGGAALVQGLLQRLPLGEAAHAALEADARFDLVANLSLLLQHGAVCAIHLPEEDAA